MTNFMRGVVENNLDVKQLGRVQVRIMGIHSDSKKDAPTETLPWCEVIQGTQMGGMISGVGVSSVLRVGTWVWVFFENNDWTHPIVFGTMIGQMTVEPTDGFKGDGQGPYVTARLGESDLHPFSRSDSTGLIDTTIPAHQQKVGTKIDNINQTPTYGTAWTEPSELSSKAVYPNNNVIETHSGHVIEIDDTLGNERVHILHRSGSYIEMRPDGSIVAKSQKDDHKIVQGNSYENILGNVDSSIEKNFDKLIKGLFSLDVEGNIIFTADIKFVGNVEVTGKVTAGNDITSKAEIRDSFGNLSSLRDEHDANVDIYNAHTHIGNLGIPTAIPDKLEAHDPKVRAIDFTWSGSRI